MYQECVSLSTALRSERFALRSKRGRERVGNVLRKKAKKGFQRLDVRHGASSLPFQPGWKSWPASVLYSIDQGKGWDRWVSVCLSVCLSLLD